MQFHATSVIVALLGFTLVTACDAGQTPSCVDIEPVAVRLPLDVPPPSISVTGFGTISAAPDTATIQIGTQTRGADPGATMAESNAKIARITAALTELGVDAGDIQISALALGQQTAGQGGPQCQTDDQCAMDEICDNGNCVFSGVQPRMKHPLPANGALAVVVDQHLTVTLRDPGKLDEVLVQSVAAGSASINGVAFGLDDPRTLTRQARSLAMADARARAEHLAAGLGVTLGSPITIAEASNGFEQYSPCSGLGPSRLNDQVTVTFRIH